MTEPLDILVIDDSEDDRLLYRRALRKGVNANYAVTDADDGEAGLTLINEEEPDCVLLDYSLPGRDGIEILKRIRVKHPFVPVVMLTGQGNEKVAVAAIQEGAQDYISKATITPESLDRVILVAVQHCALNKRVHEQRTSLEVFTRALAHDLKEPVRTIRAFSELIAAQSWTLDERTKGYFQHIHNAAERMGMLIDTVFLYTRLDHPAQMAREWCNLGEVLEEVKENAAQLIRERAARVTCGALPDVFANRSQLIQLLQNLVCNAIHHSGRAVQVHVAAEAKADKWHITVSDNGPGIDLAYRDIIFEPFKRLRGPDEPGAGLGLAICRKILDSHNGKIWCEPSDKGAAFMFTLPRLQPGLVNAPAPKAPAAAAGTVPLQLNGKELANVLLVDDRKADIEITRFWLFEHPQLHCNLLEAHDGKEALALLRKSNSGSGAIDLVLLDINMPVMDGFELLKHLQTDDSLKHVKVVMCSGSTYDKDVEMARELGALGYLTKPVKFDMLKSAIEHISTIQLHKDNGGYALLRAA